MPEPKVISIDGVDYVCANIVIKQAMIDETEKAFAVIKQAMIDDNPSEKGSYAHSWHCTIAMMCHDAIMHNTILDSSLAHKAGNDAASRFMKLCFDVETKA